MQDIKNRDFTSLISNKIHYTQRNKIATYFVSKNQNTSLSFSEEELIIFYHLLRFGYFDKEIIDLIYTAVTRKIQKPLIHGFIVLLERLIILFQHVRMLEAVREKYII